MLFNSFIFLIYLPIVFSLYWFVFHKLNARNTFIVVSSYIFYGWWDWKFLVLIAFTSLCSYISGRGIESSNRKIIKKIILWLNVLLNLGILCIFKYYNFFVHNLQVLLSPLGVNLDSITLNLILPVGISFYTFQALSYSIDVYRGNLNATKNIIAFFAFISFFPQLVAGPIERATNLLPQFLKNRNFLYEDGVDGCRQMLWGFFKKVVIADNCAQYVNIVFANYDSMGGLNLWIGAILFSFQIYGDFSGYSDIAIGVSKLFGINLMRNFKNPYFSRDIAEFWRRWHISLTTWFRDYIYIPLGGSRVKKSKVLRNTFIIFIISGLWHGAEWTFIAWGGFHSLLFAPLILSGKNRKYLDEPGKGLLPTMGESLLMGWTFLVVTIGWVIFRSDNITHAWGYIKRMFTNFQFIGERPSLMIFIFIFIFLLIEWIERKRNHTFDIVGHGLLKYKTARWLLYLFFIVICCLYAGVQSDFIYFQF